MALERKTGGGVYAATRGSQNCIAANLSHLSFHAAREASLKVLKVLTGSSALPLSQVPPWQHFPATTRNHSIITSLWLTSILPLALPRYPQGSSSIDKHIM